MRLKNLIFMLLVVILAGMLTSCSGSSNQSSPAASSSGTEGAQAATSLTQVNMLLVGTLKLEGTDQAVTTEEAKQLLPLWQAYRSLSNSQTAAEAEVDALLNQIQSSMTSDQMEAIEVMNLTSSEMMDLMQSMGGGMRLQGTPNPQSTPGFDFPSGGFQSGDLPSGSAGVPPSGNGGGPSRNQPPGGIISGGGTGGVVIVGGDAGSAAGLGGGPMFQGTPDPSMQAPAEARFSTQANQVNSMLLEVLITKLEARIAE